MTALAVCAVAVAAFAAWLLGSGAPSAPVHAPKHAAGQWRAWPAVWCVIAGGVVAAVRFVGGIQVGVTRKLGVAVEDAGAPLRSTDSAASASEAGSCRRLGILERWYVAHSRAGHHNGFQLAVELQGAPPTEAELRRLLRAVAARHAALRARVCRSDRPSGDTGADDAAAAEGKGLWGDDLFFSVLRVDDEGTAPPVRSVRLAGPGSAQYARAAAKGLERVLEEESRTGFEDVEEPGGESGPLWRAVLVTWDGLSDEFAVVFAFHHVVADARAATEVLRSLLAVRRGDDSGDLAEHAQLPPPMCDVVDTVPRLSQLMVPLLCDRMPALEAWLVREPWLGAPHDAAVPPESRVGNIVAVDFGEAADVLRAARAEKATVHGVLVAALAYAVRDVAASTEGAYLRMQSSVDVRRSATPEVPRKALGIFLCAPAVSMTVPAVGPQTDASSLFRAARRYREQLASSVPGTVRDIGMCAFISEAWPSWARKRERAEPNGRRENSCEVSNLGAVDLEDVADGGKGGWQLAGAWFSQGRVVVGPALEGSILTVRGQLHATLTGTEPAVPRQQLDDICERWAHWVGVAVAHATP